MTEFAIVALTLLLILHFTILRCIKTDFKDLKEQRRELDEAWDTYYKEARKYKKLNKVIVTFRDGEITEYDAEYYNRGDNYITLYDEYDSTTALLPKDTVKALKTKRTDEFVDGSPGLDDIL